MAKIAAATDERIFKITAWKGLNENPDGDTKLKLGEAAAMRNFRITRDGNLQRRPGNAKITGLLREYGITESGITETMRESTGTGGALTLYPAVTVTEAGDIIGSGTAQSCAFEDIAEHIGEYWCRNKYEVWKLTGGERDGDTFRWTGSRVATAYDTDTPRVAGLWSGSVDGNDVMLAACDGRIWLIHDGEDFCREDIGPIDTESDVFFFGYSGKVYMLNGSQYMEWDGHIYRDVPGYRPLVIVSATAALGAGTTLEQVNKLNGRRRAWYSPDGTATAFKIAEGDVLSVDYVCVPGSWDDMVNGTDYTVSIVDGAATVTFTSAPAAGTNSIEIGWTANVNYRSQVMAMRYAETYSGANEARVFVYGDGSNECFYSGLDYDGKPRADYFPDLNEIAVGEANTPITQLIRHYSRLIAFKSNSTYAIVYDTITLADGSTTAAFYVSTINKAIGNEAPGQVRLVLNAPYTLHGNDLFEWRTGGTYAANLSTDERQAKRISDRINASLSAFDLKACRTWDDNDAQEYYICDGTDALVYNYAADAWFKYTDFDAECMANFRGELYFGDSRGNIEKVGYEYRTANGKAIDAYWESGSLAFEKEFMRKYSAMLWVGLKPEAGGEVIVTVQTDRKSQYAEKLVSVALSSFAHTNFGRFSFKTNRKPNMTRLKIKAKKFVYYKLIFESSTPDTTATILAADIRVRFTGYAR